MENTGSGLSIGLDELISHDKLKIKMEKKYFFIDDLKY
jgi:hypothetical protein|tara:strand:+ start:14 stop:127 length:114 start_codon:yes stop_codon:yes gene_type:complete